MSDTANSILGFAKRHNISRSKVYEDITRGRIVARKNGGRTVIYDSDNEYYRESLPIVQPKERQVSA